MNKKSMEREEKKRAERDTCVYVWLTFWTNTTFTLETVDKTIFQTGYNNFESRNLSTKFSIDTFIFRAERETKIVKSWNPSFSLFFTIGRPYRQISVYALHGTFSTLHYFFGVVPNNTINHLRFWCPLPYWYDENTCIFLMNSFPMLSVINMKNHLTQHAIEVATMCDDLCVLVFVWKSLVMALVYQSLLLVWRKHHSHAQKLQWSMDQNWILEM